MGRYYAMDRDKNWDRNKLAYDAMTKGEGNKAESAEEAIQASYDSEKFDEFVIPTVITENGSPVGLIQDKDSVIFYNFRPDRARQITRHSVTMNLQALLGKNAWIWYLYALQITMRRLEISW